MNTIDEIKNKLQPCRFCGNSKLDVFHIDYEGDTYIGDEYSIDCMCGICTGYYKMVELIKIWNNKQTDKKTI